MTHPEMPKRSRGRVFIGVAIALGHVLLSPLLVGFSTTVFVFPVITVFLFGFGGWIPACAGMLLTVIAFDLYFGLAAALMAAAAFALPTAFLIRGIRWRKPFVLQIKPGHRRTDSGGAGGAGHCIRLYGHGHCGHADGPISGHGGRHSAPRAH